ncbi:MAG TPA: dephospho-CoA kinase [Galbitalea sp.]|jgi:dephospho-CoA kinase|nr:dephospho-CoA kinase [Galbitalea sp.]
MYLVGLTGGIASGKSVVARRFVEHGAVLVDADVLAREVVGPGTAGLAEIEQRFGPSVISTDGSLDRAALGALVFSDADKREQLNGITHPAIWQRAKELFEAASVANPDAVVVYDVPLLAEAVEKRPMNFDFVVVVDAPTETRIQRMVDSRGMSRQDAERRVGAQATDSQREELADAVIDSGGTIEHTLAQVDALWDRFSGG